MSETIADRIRQAREKTGLSVAELGRRVGVSRASAHQWETGQTKGLKPANLAAVADALGVSIRWLATGEGAMHQVAESTPPGYLNTTPAEIKHAVPLISWVQAGAWHEAIDNLPPGEGEELVPTDRYVGPHAYALRISGDSMEPKFPEGSKIIVDPDQEVTHRAYVIAKLDGQDVTFKQYMEDGSRKYLKPLNPSYPTLDITNLNITFCGRVIQVITDVL